MNTPKFELKNLLVPVIAAAVLVLGAAGCGDDPTGPSPPEPVPTGSGLIEGLVLHDGAPVGGATALGLGNERTLLRSTTTDDQGRFAFAGVAAGSYRLWVTPPEQYAVSHPAPGDIRVQVAADRTASIEIELALADSVELPPVETGTIRVSARDGDEPVAGVYVSVSHGESGDWAGSGRTDRDGLALVDVAPGAYDVAIIPTIWYEVDGDAVTGATVAVDETTDVAFALTRLESLPAGQLMVYVDADSLPVAGVTVYALNEDGTERLTSGVTDDRGRIAFSLDQGAYQAEIEVPEGYVLYEGQPNPMGTFHIVPGETTWAGFFLHVIPWFEP
jgi:hypothetical protein